MNDDLVRLYTKLDDMTHALVLCYACLTGEAAQFAGGMEASVREAKTLARKALAGTHHRSKKALRDSGVPERDKVLHVDQAAAILGIARSTLMNRIKQGKPHPRCFKMGNRWCFRLGDVRDHIRKTSMSPILPKPVSEAELERRRQKTAKMRAALREKKSKLNKEIVEKHAARIDRGKDTAVAIRIEDFAALKDE